MNYLLDTHTLIWFFDGNRKLSLKAQKAIETNNNNNYVSIASIWEIAIKISLERLIINLPFKNLNKELIKNNFQLLPITFHDIVILTSQPFHHNDPFDRIIIAQAIANNYTLITKDKLFSAYSLQTLW